MKKDEFILALTEELEIEKVIEGSTILKDLEEWDSMTAMLLIGFVSNEFNVTLNADDLKAISTIDSLMERIGLDKFN